MTTTPESWDDVGCLRLQVDCLSHKVGDLEDRCISHEVEDGPDIRNLNRKGEPVFHGLLDSQLQKLRDKVELQEQEQKNQRCLRDIIALLLGCVLALLFVIFMIFMIYTMLTQKLSDEPSEATTLLPATFILNASGFGGHINLNLLVPVTRTSKYERRSFQKRPTAQAPSCEQCSCEAKGGR